MLQYTQLINFEIGDKCNLTKMHPECPSNAVRSGKELTDEKILGLVNEIYTKYGFRGFIAWHFYNEPLLQADRIFNLMEQIRKDFPKSRFLLWSNCTILPEDDRIKLFEDAYLTDYLNVGMDRVYGCFKNVAHFWYKGKDISLDERFFSPYTEENHYERCLRPLVEFIIDNYGDVHFCCYDWNIRTEVGNVWNSSLDEILKKREELSRQVCGKQMTEDSPWRCLRCTFRESDPKTSDFDPLIAVQASEEYKNETFK